MKKRIVFTALTLALCFLVLQMSSCSSVGGVTWIRCGDAEIPDYCCRYWLSRIKSDFVSRFEDITDTEECWNGKTTDPDGQTITRGEYLERYMRQYAENVAVELSLFSKYGLKLDDEDLEKIDGYLDEIVYYRYSDSRSAFNTALKKACGVTMEEFRQTLIIESKVARLENHLFADGGVMAPTDSELDEYYHKNYVRFLPIVIFTESEYVRDEKGEIEKDGAGLPVTRKLTNEEKQTKQKKAEAVMRLAEDGEDFGRLAADYSESAGGGSGDGLYFSTDDIYEAQSSFGLDLSILTSVYKQEIGSVARYETNDGAIVIVKRLELPDGAYRNAADDAQFSNMRDHVVTAKNRALIEPLLNSVTVDDALYALRTVDIGKSPV